MVFLDYRLGSSSTTMAAPACQPSLIVPNSIDSKHGSSTQQTAVIVALLTFGFWGVAPVYFKWLDAVDPIVIIAHRIVWALATLLLFLRLRDGGDFWRRLIIPPRIVAGLLLSGILVSTNWFIFVWAVSNGQILETSLGYYINPLVNVLLGMMFLGERLRPLQWAAVLVAAAGTAWMAIAVGELPWPALALAFSFGFYGLVRKKLPVGPLVGLTWETALLLPVAVVLLVIADQWAFQGISLADRWLLFGTGLVTILPLVGFAFAAQRLSLSIIGFFQYLAPSISFLIAVFVYNEPLGQAKLMAFVAIWFALVMYTFSEWQGRRRKIIVGLEVPR